MAHSAVAARPRAIDKLRQENPDALAISRHDRLSL